MKQRQILTIHNLMALAASLDTRDRVVELASDLADETFSGSSSREAALRRLANKLLARLHHCLQHHEPYREDVRLAAADLAA